jgi:hypothetical protein
VKAVSASPNVNLLFHDEQLSQSCDLALHDADLQLVTLTEFDSK